MAHSIAAGGKGTVRYAGYKTGGKVPLKGIKNKRKRKMRLQKEAELREKLARQRKREEREQEYASEWESFRED